MSTHILVPVDGSPLSEQALEVALEENPGAHLTALHVIDPTDLGYSYYPLDSVAEFREEPLHGSEEWYDRAEEFAEELFEHVEETAGEYDVDLATELVIGDPAQAIVRYAKDYDVDHVIVGSHGRGEDTTITLGSVTEAVAFRSPVRVTLVR